MSAKQWYKTYKGNKTFNYANYDQRISRRLLINLLISTIL